VNDNPSEVTGNLLKSMLEDLRAEQASALRAYQVLQDHKMINRARFITYRCESARCLLADVYQTPSGVAVYRSRYRNSPVSNELKSVAPAREKRTVDGDRRWRETASLLSEFTGMGSLVWIPVSCDHIEEALILPAAIEAELLNRKPGSADPVVLTNASGVR